MSEQNGNIEEIKVEETGTEGIKATDFVEPNEGLVRKIIKVTLKALALVSAALIGGVIGHAIGSKDDNDEVTETAAEGSETESNE